MANRPQITNAAYWSKTEAELRYIIRDAGEAARNMRGLDAKAEGKYLDQVNDACTVLRCRRTGVAPAPGLVALTKANRQRVYRGYSIELERDDTFSAYSATNSMYDVHTGFVTVEAAKQAIDGWRA